MNYILDNDDLPKGEMGELQNIISLVPTLLELDKPADSLKRNLEKRIQDLEGIRLTSAEKTKIENKFKEEILPPISEPKEIKITDTKAQTIVEEDVKKQTFIEEPIRSNSSVPKEKTVLKSEPLHDVGENEIPKTKIIETKSDHFDERKSFSILPWLLAGILFVILVLVTIYFNNTNTELNNEINTIKSQLSGFQGEIATTNKFVNDHVALIEFFNHKNVEIVNFQGSDINLDASGKLLISFEAGEGLLQLKNTSPLSSNEAFQLWMVSKNESYSLGTIVTRPDLEYYKITNIPFLKKEEVRMFRITKETREGAEIPQGITYLFGVFSTEKINSKGRR